VKKNTVTVQVMETRPWIDRSQPAPAAVPVEKLTLDVPKNQRMTQRLPEIEVEIRRRLGTRCRKVSFAAPEQGFDVVAYIDPDKSGKPLKKAGRPVTRAGVHGGPIGRDVQPRRRKR